MKNKKYFLGLDIGTDSVGYAVTNETYDLIKFRGEPAWGVTVFEQASLSDQRRTFRTSRRRLERRKQRIALIQELFAKEITTVDEQFFIRLREAALFRSDVDNSFTLFNDDKYTDKDYHNQYPTIHHLICELMNSKKPHDVRLVYLACSWLVAHRGHFLSNININNLSSINEFGSVYDQFIHHFKDNGYVAPWDCTDVEAIGNIIKKRDGVTNKTKELVKLLFLGEKPSKVPDENFPYSREAIVKLLAGAKCQLKDIFGKEEYSESGSISLDMDEEKYEEIMSEIGEDYALIEALKSIYDWAVLVEVIGDGNYSSVSEAKVAVYNTHKKDLENLKYFVKKYAPQKYSEIFRDVDKSKDNYVAYTYHTNDGDTSELSGKKSQEDFCKYLKKVFEKINPSEEDSGLYNSIVSRLNLYDFMPKQKNTDNRVIPYQMYQYELQTILENAAEYLSFLSNKDEDGISVADKIISVFTFKIPYFVGPLNNKSEHAWVVRKAGKIYPWNFDKMVDFDASEQEFIRRMTNYCTYLPGEPVLPKDSLAYHKFTVLNEINNIRINGQKISVELKQEIFKNIFMSKKKVSRKFIAEYFVSNNYLKKGEEGSVSGIDINLTSNLSSQISFKRLFENGVLSEDDAEKIIERASYAEDKSRLNRWIELNYQNLDEKDRKYICGLKIKDFGRLSRKFLCEMLGVCKETGETMTIIEALWTTQDNLMEILSSKYTFIEKIEGFNREYYEEHKETLSDRLDEMYISNAVRRPIFRTLDIVKDIEKAFGCAPDKIFVETTRGASPDQKGKRTKTRKEQIIELYDQCKNEDVKYLKKQLEDMGELADNKLQGDKLFLYYMQLGKSMYSGKPIDLEKLGTKLYDIDHIYPQALVKDDSIINNKVLVLSTENGEKKDIYPIKEDIRKQMTGFWHFLKESKLISEEKYRRLVRNTPFTDEEKFGFINRQLTETSQATKAVATLLKERYPDCEIVYSKARLVSDFRHEFEIYKSRLFNDLHHAVDAYLNIVVGNVYHMKFSGQWFNINSNYSMKTKTLFTRPLEIGGKMIWNGEEMLKKVKKTAYKNNAHFTKYAFFKRGGLFDQMPVSAKPGLVPLKKGLPTEKYGGYNKSSAMFYIPVKYKSGKKEEILIMSVEMMYGKRFLADNEYAREYSFSRIEHIRGKKVEDVWFPLGMRPWKVNTMLSLDGFRVCITGIANGGGKLSIQSIMQFSENYFWQYYLKKLEMFVEKMKNNPKYIYDEEFDNVCIEKNVQLYDIYIEKYRNSIYQKRINSPLKILEDGREQFRSMDVKKQSSLLISIHQTFGRLSGGCDLTLISGKKNSAVTSISAFIINWKKNYKDVRIIDSSVSGLWEKQSINLLELI